MQTDTNMELISTAACPYAQRKKIVLTAKGIDARIREIDFKAPPKYFLARSPLAKVPVLLAAHRIRVADGEDRIEERHVAAALRSLVAETQESLSQDRGLKKAYVERVEEP